MVLYQILKTALLISGIYLLALVIWWVSITLNFMEEKKQYEDAYGFLSIIVMALWFICLMLSILTSCVITGVLIRSQILIFLFNVGSILISFVNLAVLKYLSEYPRLHIFQIIFAPSMGIIIILSYCYICHPKNQRYFEQENRENLVDEEQS